jgi:sigma-E factor negative regulatory protein RseC
MDTPIATIISIADGMATVTVSRSVVCARCAAGKGCGAGLLNGNPEPARLQLPVPGAMRLRTGDQVYLELSADGLLKASFLVYGLPLVGIVTALFAGWLIAGPLNDASTIGLSLAGMLAGLVVARTHIGRDRCLEQFVPKITRRAPLPAA